MNFMSLNEHFLAKYSLTISICQKEYILNLSLLQVETQAINIGFVYFSLLIYHGNNKRITSSRTPCLGSLHGKQSASIIGLFIPVVCIQVYFVFKGLVCVRQASAMTLVSSSGRNHLPMYCV